MFLKVFNGEVFKYGEIKGGNLVPLINVDERKVFLVKIIGDNTEFKKVKEYDIESIIGKIYWNMINLDY